MKKKLLVTAIMLTLSVGTAFANPVELDGTASYRYRSDTNPLTIGDKDGSITKIVLNAKTNITENFDFYARLGIEGVSNAGWNSPKDFNDTSKSFVGELDQFGFLYNNAGFTYKLGRQSATIGATALLYNENFKVGKHAFVDGVHVTGKTGVTSIDAIAAQEDNAGSADNKLYAVRGSYSPAENWTVGATLAKYDYANAGATNHWAVDASYTAGKANYFGEYTKSDADTKNTGYDLGISYSFDAKNSAYVIYNKVEANGDMGKMTDFEVDAKSVYYGFDHKFDKATTGSLFFRDRKGLSGVTSDCPDNTSFRATVSYKF